MLKYLNFDNVCFRYLLRKKFDLADVRSVLSCQFLDINFVKVHSDYNDLYFKFKFHFFRIKFWNCLLYWFHYKGVAEAQQFHRYWLQFVLDGIFSDIFIVFEFLGKFWHLKSVQRNPLSVPFLRVPSILLVQRNPLTLRR